MEIDETTAFVPTEVVTGPSGSCTISSVTWNTDDPSTSATYKIETRTTFTFSDGPSPGQWFREHGLYGGAATATPDSGTIFNIANHARIWKDNTVELVRYFRHELTIQP